MSKDKMHCDWCGSKVNVAPYMISGPSHGKVRIRRVNICNGCSAKGVLSANWYGLDERIGILTDVDYDHDDEGNLFISIEHYFDRR